jgi:hypothetical protein
MKRGKTQMGKPGKSSPAMIRVYLPKASARKLHQRMRQIETPSGSLSQSEGVCRFFGASPVASALGIRSGATPCGPTHSKPDPGYPPSKPDISTLLTLGHFYFALTEGDLT